MTAFNADHHEIAKFEAVAKDWWNPNGPLKTLHHINPVRLKFIADRVTLSGRKIIDVGCGGGILTESLATQGGLVTGIDLCGEALEEARAHAQQSQLKIDYYQASAETMTEHAAQFAVVTCLELLEHVPDPKALIAACANLVEPGGDIFFSTLNRNLKAYTFAILGAEYLLKLLPKGTHQYARFIRPSELAGWVRESGLTLKELSGLSYNPITHHCHLVPDVSVNYLVHCQRNV